MWSPPTRQPSPAGNVEAVVAAFEPDGYFREPRGPQYRHRGTDELREFFTLFFSAGGGIGLQHCTVTDDETRCALEYNCVRWGKFDLPPQAGVAVYERGPSGRLAAARVYDDVQAPVEDDWQRAPDVSSAEGNGDPTAPAGWLAPACARSGRRVRP